MAPLYDPSHESPESSKACIDQFEFPDIPCECPVVWVKAKEAAELCEAEGKRLCDAHEWEGACDGRLEAPDYPFELAKGVAPEVAIRSMRLAHNRHYAPSQRWSYGPTYQRGICATGSTKSADCNGGSWTQCGSNTYPAGSFPACHSPLDVYDLNGNAAEHMNLPIAPDQMSSRGSKTLGYTEMKGSWFIFDTYRAHEDWCRWRAPFWHGTRVLASDSHANYHLGFRCCSTLTKSP
jgi:formylglycine-generating enzyme required for sulfatase activity